MKKKVLISAYDCQPRQGSEWGLSWNWASQMSNMYEVWVVTSSLNKEEIVAAMADVGTLSLKFIYVDPVLRIRKVGRGASYWALLLEYELWQIKAYLVVRRLHRSIKFDLIHHLSWTGISAAGLMWLIEVPFIMGPVGGGQFTHLAFLKTFGRYSVNEIVRTMFVKLQRFNPLVTKAVKASRIVIACNGETARQAVLMGAREVRIMASAGAKLPARSAQVKPSRSLPVVLMVGRFHPQKGHILALNALAVLKNKGYDASLVICGDGPMRPTYERKIRSLGLEGSVTLTGWLSQRELEKYYVSSDVFVFPSIREPFGMVLIEAMSYGLPIVALDHQAAREIITEEVGIRIPVTHPHSVIHDLASALQLLIGDTERREKMRTAARERVSQMYSWDRLRQTMQDVYELAMDPARYDKNKGLLG
jgi:glycosyltransferase involved in cell wall biosynthesis